MLSLKTGYPDFSLYLAERPPEPKPNPKTMDDYGNPISRQTEKYLRKTLDNRTYTVEAGTQIFKEVNRLLYANGLKSRINFGGVGHERVPIFCINGEKTVDPKIYDGVEMLPNSKPVKPSKPAKPATDNLAAGPSIETGPSMEEIQRRWKEIKNDKNKPDYLGQQAARLEAIMNKSKASTNNVTIKTEANEAKVEANIAKAGAVKIEIKQEALEVEPYDTEEEANGALFGKKVVYEKRLDVVALVKNFDEARVATVAKKSSKKRAREAAEEEDYIPLNKKSK